LFVRALPCGAIGNIYSYNNINVNNDVVFYSYSNPMYVYDSITGQSVTLGQYCNMYNTSPIDLIAAFNATYILLSNGTLLGCGNLTSFGIPSQNTTGLPPNNYQTTGNNYYLISINVNAPSFPNPLKVIGITGQLSDPKTSISGYDPGLVLLMSDYSVWGCGGINLNVFAQQITPQTNPLPPSIATLAGIGLKLLYPSNLVTNPVLSVIRLSDSLTNSAYNICFKHDTKILTPFGYIPIQDLKPGDLVKTLYDNFVSIKIIGKKEFYHIRDKNRIKDQLYRCSRNKYPELFEDLVITGCHSILVGRFVDRSQEELVVNINGGKYVTDGKYRLPACADEKAIIYEKQGLHMIYHLALEHENKYMNYGIFANGLLVESCSENNITKIANMELIE
jgi:hypothetical protein